MSLLPELEIVDKSLGSVRYLEHGWPTELCRWHAHEEYELHLMLATHGKAFIGDFIGEFGPGSLYLVGPRLPHNWVTSTGKQVAVRDMLCQFHHDAWAAAAAAYPELRELGGLLADAAKGVEFVGYPAAQAKARLRQLRDAEGLKRLLLLLELLAELAAWPRRCVLSVLEPAVAASGQEEFSHVIEHIMRNYTGELSMGTVAEIAGLGPSAFSRRFQRVTGNRFSDFVARVRVGHACALLMESDAKVADIAPRVGFNNLANFNRQFLHHKGVAPSEYRLLARARLAERQLPTAAGSPA
ncbi:MAG: helix-turn-helix domain-containing protein [Betaproteobacteria bacterium AqS2]|uniref:Helix-turn-helix domain-containing protein n=1 Tax=Candidatus Amphirhobacter heronislandensis TaxID=1732024 RepID=A0A930UDN4_9GAMM|nr:helix-turn-helix domain-containing protein [Betaproteobacteria bacterium AqS2]